MMYPGWRWKEADLNAADMAHIIRIHNANNEGAWREVLKWEAMHADECGEPKLKSFGGKATKFSPARDSGPGSGQSPPTRLTILISFQ